MQALTNAAADRRAVRRRHSGGPDWLLPALVIIAGAASYHRSYDHCTAKYLEQAGVRNTFIPLDERGIDGNGHMMMLEKNNLEISAFLRQWLEKKVSDESIKG